MSGTKGPTARERITAHAKLNGWVCADKGSIAQTFYKPGPDLSVYVEYTTSGGVKYLSSNGQTFTVKDKDKLWICLDYLEGKL